MFIKRVLFYFLFLIISCDSQSYVRTYSLPNTVSNTNNKILKKEIQDTMPFIWVKPAQWTLGEGHALRLVSFIAPYSEGNGDISVTTFEGESGGVEANVNRWRRQVGLPALSKSKIESQAQVQSSPMGKYQFFQLLNNEKIDTAILASIFKLESRTLFIKLATSKKGVLELEEDFLSFCSSLDYASE